MVIRNNVKLISEATSATTSKDIINQKSDVCVLGITGTFTSAEVVVEGKQDTASSTYFPLGGVNTKDFSLAAGTYTSAGIYEIDIIGVKALRARVVSVTGGNISVSAQLVGTGV